MKLDLTTDVDALFDGLPVVLTVDEAAAVLRIGRDAIYEGIRQNTFPHVRIGKRLIRIPRERLRELLAGPRTQNRPAEAAEHRGPLSPARPPRRRLAASRRG